MNKQKLEEALQNMEKEKPTSRIYVDQHTHEKIRRTVFNINCKTFGRRVSHGDYVAEAISLMKEKNIEKLKRESMTGMERLKLAHKEHIDRFGEISFEDFLYKLNESISSESSD